MKTCDYYTQFSGICQALCDLFFAFFRQKCSQHKSIPVLFPCQTKNILTNLEPIFTSGDYIIAT